MLITFVAYMPVWHAGFIWDDDRLITENQFVKAPDGWYRAWVLVKDEEAYPLTRTLRWLEWRMWGESATGYHILNILFHAVNAVLMWLVLRRLKIPGAWLAALVFAVHPVNVATVAWVSEQKTTLSMLFYLLAILLYLRFEEEGRWRWYSVALVMFLLALLSKTSVVMLPLVLLVCVWWLYGRWRWRDVLCSGPFFVCSLVWGLVSVRVMGGCPALINGPLSRVITAGCVPWFYLYKALLPVGLTVIYPMWDINPSRLVWYLPGVLLMGCFALFWWNRKTWGKPLLFGLGYFVASLFPVLGFFRIWFYSLVWDHWQYYSIVGAIALAVAGGVAICRRIGTRGQHVGVLASVAVLVTLGAATWARAHAYADPQTLWRDSVAKNPNAWAAHNNLGFALSQAGKLQGAIEHYELALRLEPTFAETHFNLGNALDQAGRTQEAIAQYQLAAQINPGYAEAHNNLGVALTKVGEVKDALEHFEQALRIRPEFDEAHFNMGNALMRVGKLQDAVEHYEQAVRIRPDNVEAQLNLGGVLLQLGRSPEAIGHFEQAVRIKPDYAEAHYNLGLALMQAGKLEDAIGHFEQALRIAPDDAEAHYNTGNALFGLGKVREAAAQYEQALRLKPDFAEAKTSLARLRAVQ